MYSNFKLIFKGIALLGVTVLVLSCGGGGGGSNGNTAFTESDLVGKWAVSKIEGIPDTVGGPSIVDQLNSTFLFRVDGNYEWFFLFDRSPFLFDLQGSGTYSFTGSELTITGVVADTILDLLPQKKITLTVSSDKNTFSFLDDENDRWTYNRVTSSLSSVIPVTDVNLRSCIDATGATRIDQVTSLACIEEGIADISGIEYLTSLTSLNLSGNGLITDISPLSTLTGLTQFVLAQTVLGASITDISPLSYLTNLTSLSLNGNGLITDISPLTTLTNLNSLSLSGVWFVDISPLLTLPNLTFLGLSNTNRSDSDLSSISTLTSLTNLVLSANGLTDITPLSNLINLTALDLAFNNITDISPLSTLTSLNALYLRRNNINDIDSLSSLTSLTLLGLNDNNVTTGVASLTTLTNIGALEFSGNNGIPCTDLDTLETVLGLETGPNSGYVRPDTCI